MVNNKIRVLIADDDIDFCFVCKEQINLFPDVMCCGVAHDGREVIRKIIDLQPDVVLLDDIMPVLDGLGVLEQIQVDPPAKMPHFIANSASGQDHIARQLLHSGAAYFLEKPFEAETLVRRIRTACSADKLSMELKSGKSASRLLQPLPTKPTAVCLEKAVVQLVLEIGVPTKLLGHDYIQESVCILFERKAARPTLKQVYEIIAERHDSDARCVENAISSAIKAALANKTSAMEDLLCMLPENGTKTISNGKFLTLVTQSIRLTSL